jgi:hypothetical protein
MKTHEIYRAVAHRLTALNGLGVDAKVHAGLAKLFESAAEVKGEPLMTYQGKDTPVKTVMDLARNHVPEAMTALQSLRVENIDLLLKATFSFGYMFETIDLRPEEQPMIDITYRNPTNVRFAGEDGGVRTVKAVKARGPVFFNMRELHSDTFNYPIRDINLGTSAVEAAAEATVDTAWDLQHKINVEQFNFLQGGVINGVNYGQGNYRAFNFSGKSLANTGILHPSIQVANLPTTNLINYGILAENYNQVDNYMSFGVLQAIIDYIEGFRGVFRDGDLEATGLIIVPSSETTGLLKRVNPAGTISTKVGETVLNSFTKVEYGGRVWTLLGTPVLPKGACYPVLNKKVANYYTKTSLDFEDVATNKLKNFEERTTVKVIQLAQIEPWRVNALKVVYSQAAGAGVVTQNN